MEMPFSVAVTVRVTDPVVEPAVKVVVGPLDGLTDPKVLFRVQA